MPVNNDEKRLGQCFETAIKVIYEIIAELQPASVSQSDTLSVDSIMNNINTFTLDTEEDEKIDEVKMKIENIFQEYLPHLSAMYQNYALNFLCQYGYDSEKRKFSDSLSIGTVLPLYRGFQGLLASIDAFKAAWNGSVSAVEKFVTSYPTLKNKPGLWGTTLLYSAAKNGHLDLVEYLIEIAKCSVNAQNEQHLGKILSSTKKTLNYDCKAKAASTALHGACFNGHLKIVQYLVEHGANYFIKNQALETPLMNIGNHKDIQQYFQNYLLLGYSRNLSSFPDRPISEENTRQVDCVWEFKSLNASKWDAFSSDESNTLQESLIINPDKQFRHEIRLTVNSDIYSVSVVQFLRSGKKRDENDLAWVRCRGSSILNFNCYSLWQIMFLKHPQAETNVAPSLDVSSMPTTDDLSFKIQLHSWYNCDATTNSQLDVAMDYRKKIVSCTLVHISAENLNFNLRTFSFINETKTITGYIRWIPKLVSNNEQDKNKIRHIDNFAGMTNLNPIPLTVERSEQITAATDSASSKADGLFEEENGDDAASAGFSNDLDDDDDDKDDDSQNSEEVNV